MTLSFNQIHWIVTSCWQQPSTSVSPFGQLNESVQMTEQLNYVVGSTLFKILEN